MIEPLTGDGDVQRAHVGEVGRRQVSGIMHLTKHDALPPPVSGPPLSHTPLERAAMRIEEPAWMFASQPVEERLGKQPRLSHEPLLHRRPDLGERIDPRAVGPPSLPRTRQGPLIAVMSGSLGIHANSPGHHGQGGSKINLTKKLANSAIRNHRIPPSFTGGAPMAKSSKRGNSNCRWWGFLIVGRHA